MEDQKGRKPFLERLAEEISREYSVDELGQPTMDTLMREEAALRNIHRVAVSVRRFAKNLGEAAGEKNNDAFLLSAAFETGVSAAIDMLHHVMGQEMPAPLIFAETLVDMYSKNDIAKNDPLYHQLKKAVSVGKANWNRMQQRWNPGAGGTDERSDISDTTIDDLMKGW